jgi:hypothetical protein
MGESQAGCAFLCAIAVAMGVGSQQSQAPPVFKAGVELVQIDLTVLDRYRVPVGDLAPGEVTVLENGRPRPIAMFSRVDVRDPEFMNSGRSTAPASAERPSPASDMSSMASPDAEPRYGRLVAIMCRPLDSRWRADRDGT